MKIKHFHPDRTRKENLFHIDPWDTWCFSTTLQPIILPMLKQLKETTHGAPFVDDEDVPEYLRNTPLDEHDLPTGHFDRWDYVLDSMIYAFENVLDDNWFNEPQQKATQTGLVLFGKYFRNLWD